MALLMCLKSAVINVTFDSSSKQDCIISFSKQMEKLTLVAPSNSRPFILQGNESLRRDEEGMSSINGHPFLYSLAKYLTKSQRFSDGNKRYTKINKNCSRIDSVSSNAMATGLKSVPKSIVVKGKQACVRVGLLLTSVF